MTFCIRVISNNASRAAVTGGLGKAIGLLMTYQLILSMALADTNGD